MKHQDLVRRMALWLCVVFVICAYESRISAQQSYTLSSRTIYKYNLLTGQQDSLTTVELNPPLADIALSTLGELFGISDNVGFYLPELLRIDPMTGETEVIYVLPDSVRINGMTTRSDDVLYMLGRTGDLWTYDLVSNVAESLGKTPYRFDGDMTWYKGELYYAYHDYDTRMNNVVRIHLDDLMREDVVISRRMPRGISGITSISASCDSLEIYAFDFIDSVYRVDIERREIIGHGRYMYSANGAASTGEFFGSIAPVSVDDVRYTEELCDLEDAELSVTASGGAGDLSYSINGGASYASDAEFADLSAGEYIVVVSDTAGCTDRDTVIIPRIGVVEIDSVAIRPATCGENNAVIEILADGTGVTYSLDGQIFQSSNTYSNLAGGERRVYLQSDEGCIDSALIDIPVIDRPMITSVDTRPRSCHGLDGAVWVDALGDGPLMYSTDGVSYQGSSELVGLDSGAVTVYVQDQWGCTMSDVVTITQYALPQISDSIVVATSCGEDNGVIDIEATGQGDLLYVLDDTLMSDVGRYGQLAARLYQLVITDSLGCSIGIDIYIEPSQAAELDLLSREDVTCGDRSGSLQVVGTGGVAPYEYSMDGVSYQAESTYTDLSAGGYTVYLQDAQGCEDSLDVLIDSLAHVLIDSVMVTEASCGRAGSVRVHYDSPSAVTALLDGQLVDDLAMIDSLERGAYELILVDSSGCRDTSIYSITGSEELSVSVSAVIQDICELGEGQVLLDLETAGIEGLLVNGERQQVSSVLDRLTAGDYLIEVMNEQGCSWDTTLTITTTAAPRISRIDRVQPTDCSLEDGQITVIVDDQVQLAAIWIDGQRTMGSIIDGLREGVYQVTIEDTAGCEVEREVRLDQQDCPVYIPNVFSPNGDGVNDRWAIYVSPEAGIRGLSIQVYDRWGSLIYDQRNALTGALGWDGKYKGQVVPLGVYVYVLRYEGLVGDVVLSGDVTVVR